MWRARPIFVSSTFADMQAERDHLRLFVFPELEERLRKRRHTLEWVDLRMGVAPGSPADSETHERQVLRVCLAEVRRCRPFIIVLLGDRYGWVPPRENIVAAAVEEGFEGDVEGCSVTDLEIRFGVLADAEQTARTRFYFREPLPYDEMPPDVAAVYADHLDLSPAAKEQALRLAALKEEIHKRFPQQVRHYRATWDRRRSRVTELEAWGRQVVEDIWAALEAETEGFAAREELSWQQSEQLALEDYFHDRARDFVGRKGLLDSLVAHATSTQTDEKPWCFSLTGESGTGKSAVIGKLYQLLKEKEQCVFAHAAGASPQASSVDNMLLRWIAELASQLKLDPAVPANADPETIETVFYSLLDRMAKRCRVVLLIDALDQFENTPRAQFLTWLREVPPSNVRLIATAVPGDPSGVLSQRRGVRVTTIPALDESEARNIIETICARYHRTLEPQVVEAVLAKSSVEGPAWTNALWLVLAIEELNLLDQNDFERALRKYSGSNSERLRCFLVDFVQDMPADVAGIYETTFVRAEQLFGHLYAIGFLGLISASRAGLRESDFRALLPRYADEPWDELRYASLRRLFRGQLRQRDDLAQWDFNHTQMRHSVRQRMAALGVPDSVFHGRIAAHLLSLPPDDPFRESETMIHLIGGEKWLEAAKYYGDPDLGERALERATQTLVDTATGKAFDGQGDSMERVVSVLNSVEPHDGEHPESSQFPDWRDLFARRIFFSLYDVLTTHAESGIRIKLLGATNDLVSRLKRPYGAMLNSDRAKGLAALESVLGERMVHLLGEMGDMEGQDKLSRLSLQNARTLAESEPENAYFQTVLASSTELVGDSLFRKGDYGSALRAYEESRAFRTELAHRFPNNITLRHALSATMLRVGDAKLAIGDSSGTLETLQQASRIAEDLAHQNRNDGSLLHHYAIALMSLGHALEQTGDRSGAFAACEKACEILRDLNARDPQNAFWQRELSFSIARIGEIHFAKADFPAALAAYEECKSIRVALSNRDSWNTGWKVLLSQSFIRIGDVHTVSGNQADALAAYESSYAVLDTPQLRADADANSAKARWLPEVVLSLEKFGKACIAIGDRTRALEAYEKCVPIGQALIEQDPKNTQWQAYLWGAFLKIASISSEPIRYWHEAVRVFEQLRKKDLLGGEGERWLDLAKSKPKLLELATDAENVLHLRTKHGHIEIVLRSDLAPRHVARIKELARSGFFDGAPFHRVIRGFMAQTGDPTGTGRGGSGQRLEAEFSDEPHVRGTASMARGNDPDSADSQFFIVCESSPHLDGQYTVWGHVMHGMEYVDAIKAGDAAVNGLVTDDPDRIISLRVAADVS